MAFRLTPRERTFYPMFSDAAANIVRAAELLAELVATEPAGRPALAEQIKAIEHAGDEVTHAILVKLNSAFITPFDREDIHRLASTLDDVLDDIEEAADRIVLYRLGTLPAGVAELCEVLRQASIVTASAMDNLATLSDMAKYTIEVNSLENAGDALHRKLLGELLAPRDGAPTDVLNVLKVKEVVDILEDAADAFEQVANTVESIAVKEA